MAENLWAISIDPDEAMREYVLLQLRVRAMRDMLFRSRIFTYLTAATPGLRELVTIGKIWEVSQPDRKVKKGRKYDLVIVDAPATGHGVAFLQTPRTFANIARVGPIKAQAEALETFIVNHRKTGVAIVALPEEMPVNETAALERDARRGRRCLGRPGLHERPLPGAVHAGRSSSGSRLWPRRPTAACAARCRAALQREPPCERPARAARPARRARPGAASDPAVHVRARGRGRGDRRARRRALRRDQLNGRGRASCSRASGSASAPARAASARRPARRRSPPGWRPAGRRSRC